MLSVRRTLTQPRLARAPALYARRNLCAPVVPLVDEVRAELAVMKEKVGQTTTSGYTFEAYSAALAAGTVDSVLLSQTMDFSDEARKMILKLNSSSKAMAKEMETPMVADFSSYDSKIDPAVVAEIAAIYKSELDVAMKENDSSTTIATVEKEISAIFNGSGGLFELARKEEKASQAGMVQCIADMEKLEVDVQGVANVTIGEILDREPELRAEIEEEIKNNVWAP